MVKVALITGCSTGLGRALCYGLHFRMNKLGEKEYRVFATARTLSSLKELEEEGMDILELDVKSQESVENCVRTIVGRVGRIDLLINNAGVAGFGPVLEQPLSEIQHVLDTNVVGLLRMTQEVGRVMVDQRSGIIVNIGSVSAYLVTPYGAAYCASKAAVHAIDTALQMELQPFGIRVCTVVAGAIKSSWTENGLSNSSIEKYSSEKSMYHSIAAGIKKRITMAETSKGIKTPEETAAAIIQQLTKQPGNPPAWLYAGGNWRYYLLMGFLQSWFNPTWIFNSLLKAFYLDSYVANN